MHQLHNSLVQLRLFNSKPLFIVAGNSFFGNTWAALFSRRDSGDFNSLEHI